jgi:hypothetical protein
MRHHELALGALVLGTVLVSGSGWGQELRVRRSTFSETMGAPGYSALVAARSRALGALSRDIATAISDLPC